jgi:hypothetical protein
VTCGRWGRTGYSAETRPGAEVVARLLAERTTRLMVFNMPYGIELDAGWRLCWTEWLRGGRAELHEDAYRW